MLQQENTGLIVIDIQGKLARLVHDSETLISHCQKLISGAKTLDLPIIVLEQNPTKLGGTIEELSALLENTSPITKFTFDACQSPEFMNKVNASKVDTWLICGIEAHICVYQTTLSLIETGLTVQLVTDCIASRTIENKSLAIEKLKRNGCDITSLEMCLYELMKDCRTTKFKEILHLIK